MYVHASQLCMVPEEVRKDVNSPGTGVSSGCPSSHGCWEWKLPLKEQSVLFRAISLAQVLFCFVDHEKCSSITDLSTRDLTFSTHLKVVNGFSCNLNIGGYK